MHTHIQEIVTVNGTEQPWQPGLTVGALLASLSLDPAVVVVERNGSILPREGLEESPLAAGDMVELVHFVGGG